MSLVGRTDCPEPSAPERRQLGVQLNRRRSCRAGATSRRVVSCCDSVRSPGSIRKLVSCWSGAEACRSGPMRGSAIFCTNTTCALHPRVSALHCTEHCVDSEAREGGRAVRRAPCALAAGPKFGTFQTLAPPEISRAPRSPAESFEPCGDLSMPARLPRGRGAGAVRRGAARRQSLENLGV